MLLLATKEAKVKALPNAPEAADLQRIAGNAAQEKLENLEFNFFYDGLGNRVAKSQTDERGTRSTHYTRDAQGNTMAVYQHSVVPRRLNLSSIKNLCQNA